MFKVSDLRESFLNSWDIMKLSDIYLPEIDNKILCTPFSLCGNSDSLVFVANPSGKYSVSSGYKCLLSSTMHHVEIDFRFPWKDFWKIKAPRRLLMFIWRLGNKAKPSGEILQKHHINGTINYMFCHSHLEDLDHVFITCDFARALWFGLNLAV